MNASNVFNKFGAIATTLLGLIFVTFIIGRVMPIDPVLAAVGDRVTADAYEQVKAELGLNLPLYQQFFYYCIQALKGDFGISFLTTNPVIDDLKRVFPATIELATIATLLSIVIGIPLGMLGAIYQNRWPDHIVRIVSLFGNSVSIFWLGLMGLWIFYFHLDWLPGPGRIDSYFEYYTGKTGFILLDTALDGEWDIFFSALSHIILPASILAYYKLALISRMTRTFVLNELNQEYILTAKAKGIPAYKIIFVHAFRNAAIPLITVIGLSYATVLEGSTFIETIYLWPGIGFYLTQALKNADMNAVLGCTLLIGAIFIFINYITDFIYIRLDPRLKRDAS